MSATPHDPHADGDGVAALIDALRRERRTFATAESLTGGLLSVSIACSPGAGEVFLGGIVSYASEVKANLLDVPPGPVVSRPAAEAMALGAARLLGADLAASLTGVAGPDPQDDLPPGTVFVAVALDGVVVSCDRLALAGDPDEIRAAATRAAARRAADALERVRTPRR